MSTRVTKNGQSAILAGAYRFGHGPMAYECEWVDPIRSLDGSFVTPVENGKSYNTVQEAIDAAVCDGWVVVSIDNDQGCVAEA